MSFRQFPATDANGESYVIIEFKAERQGNTERAAEPAPRYELADGRHLDREGRQFRTRGGELTLST